MARRAHLESRKAFDDSAGRPVPSVELVLAVVKAIQPAHHSKIATSLGVRRATARVALMELHDRRLVVAQRGMWKVEP